MRMAGVGRRNVFRNRRRSALNIIAIAVSTWILVLGMGWVQGYHTYLYNAVIDFETGDLQILEEGYLDEALRNPLDLTVQSYAALRRLLSDVEGVLEAAGRVEASVELSNGRSSLRLLGRAIDPPAEAEVTVIDEFIAEGEYLDSEGGVLVGRPVADKLQLEPGDSVFLSAIDSAGRQNVMSLVVRGIFDFGYPAVDEQVFYLDLHSAYELLNLEDEVSRIAVRLEPGSRFGATAGRLRTALREAGRLAGVGEAAGAAGQAAGGGSGGTARDATGDADSGLIIYPWQRFAQTTVSAVKADTFSFAIMLAILFILIVLGILNSMSMSIHERTGEIATIRAIGIRRRGVVRLLLIESLSLSVIAGAVAVIASIPVAIWLDVGGVDIGKFMPEDLPIPFGSRFHADFRIWHYVAALGAASGTAILGTIIPARRAATVNMAAALQGKK